MFAAITPALITGAFAERKRFGAFVLFTILWSILVYSPLAHWVWSVDGWLFKLGALDFAAARSSTSAPGLGAHRGAAHRSPRRSTAEPMEPHDVPMTVLGAASCGSAGSGSTPAPRSPRTASRPSAFIVTNTAAAAATITWVLASYLHKGKVSVVGAACGAVAGLVAITPASGFVTVGGALIIGLVVGGLCYSATLLRSRLKIDDALDVFAVHGWAGCSGRSRRASSRPRPSRRHTRACSKATVQQLVNQLIAVVATIAYAVVSTFLIVKVVDLILGIRVSPRDEEIGIDLATHGEVAYQT
jgi:Amt family ammonium transporter